MGDYSTYTESMLRDELKKRSISAEGDPKTFVARLSLDDRSRSHTNRTRRNKPQGDRSQQRKSQAHYGGNTIGNLTIRTSEGSSVIGKTGFNESNQHAQALPGSKEKRISEHVVIPDSDDEVEVGGTRDDSDLKHSKRLPCAADEVIGGHRSNVLSRSGSRPPPKDKTKCVISIDSDSNDESAKVVRGSKLSSSSGGVRTLENQVDIIDVNEKVMDRRTGLSLKLQEGKKSRYVIDSDSDEDEESTKTGQWGAIGSRRDEVLVPPSPQTRGESRHALSRESTGQAVNLDESQRSFTFDADHGAQQKGGKHKAKGGRQRGLALGCSLGIVGDTAGMTGEQTEVRPTFGGKHGRTSTRPIPDHEQSVAEDIRIRSIDSSCSIKGKEKLIDVQEQKQDDKCDIFEQATSKRHRVSAPWGALDYQRLDYQVYEDLVKPARCVAFMQMARDYMEYLRELSPEDVDSERSNVEKFLHMINNDIAWPLVKTVVPEFRHPIIGNDEGNLAFRYVLDAVQHRTLEHMVRHDYISEYEQKLVWDRTKATIDYLSFVRGRENIAETVRERDEMLATLRGVSHPEDVDDVDMLREKETDLRI